MEPQPSNALEVFYSYSHKDEELRNQMATNLAMLKREGVIKEWHDRGISAGQVWDGEIDLHLQSADIILLLVSPDFLASDYCYDIEVRKAMERHATGEARVIPIILRPCDWTSAPFGKVQALPKDTKPVTRWDDVDEAFLDIAKGIRRAAEEINSKHRAQTQSPAEEVKPTPQLHIPDILRVAFVERQDREGNNIVERLKEELAPHKNRLIALWGAGGVGKTAIAVEAVRALVGAYDQRVAWVSADGREDFNLTTLLDETATQLGRIDLRKLALEPKKEQVGEVLMTAPTLIVLDNFETITPEEANHCAEWLAQPALCSALITTRQKVEAAHRNIPITTMLSEEAHDLLQRLIEEVHDRNAFASLDRESVIQTAESNPLVLQWVVGQIDLAQDAKEVLSELRQGEGTAAERVFTRSFELKQMDSGGRAVLLALSLFVPSATRKSLAVVAGLDKEKDRKRFKEAIKTLSSLWLLNTADAGERLVVEGLTRELTKARLSHDPRSKTLRPRYVARFLRHAEANSKTTIEHLNSMEMEKDNVLSSIDVAFELNDWKSALRICAAIGEFLLLRGYWDESARRGEQALKAARDIKAEKWIAFFAHMLALVQGNHGNLVTAHDLYNESLEINRKLGNQSGIATSLHQLGSLAEDRGDLEEASRLYNESLEIDRKLGNQGGIATSLRAMGILVQEQGEIERARQMYDESLKIAKRLGSQSDIAYSLHQLGTISLAEEDYQEAESLFTQSLTILRRLDDKQNIAECLESMGDLRVAQKLFAEALALYSEALQIAEALSGKFRIASVKHSLALLAEKTDDRARATQLLREALSAFEELGSAKAKDARQDLERLERETS